jgi:hypothetical protein
MESVGFIDAEYNIYDGGHVEHNCTDINKAQFSYNNAVYLLGAAYMYNYVSSLIASLFRCPVADPPSRRPAVQSGSSGPLTF